MPELETVTIEGVEILSTGGPIHGVGSPPEGDFWTADDLQAMATAAHELEDAGEWRVAARADGEPLGRSKLGHGSEQTLLAASELPAAGWLTNQRVSDDGTKLLADVVEVPKKLGSLIKAKAYRTRSSELSSVTSQKTGKTYPWVASGLAWLGGKMPAVRTLDDIVAMYEHEGVEVKRVVSYAVGAVVWDPEQSFEGIRNDISEALNGTGYIGPMRYWVRDVSMDGTALVCEGYDSNDALIAAWTRGADGTITVAPSSDWVQAEQTWVETAKAYESRRIEVVSRSKRTPADTGPMAFTDDQRRKFAEATGLEADKVTDEMLTNAGVAAVEEEAKPDDEPVVELENDAKVARALELAEKADERTRTLEQDLKSERGRNFVELALREGKITPGQRKSVLAMYETNPEAAREFVAEAIPNEDLAREYGSDDEEIVTEEQRKLEQKNADADTAARLGIPEEQLI